MAPKTKTKAAKVKGKAGKPAKGGDVINLSNDDYEQKGGKNFPVAPNGTYRVKITKKTDLAAASSGNGKNLRVFAEIVGGPHKGIDFLDVLAPHVGWKIAQILSALGVKRMQLTLQELKDMLVGKELRVVLKTEKYNDKDRNSVVQWLPLEATAEEEDDEDDEDEDEDDEETDTESDDEDEDDEDEESDDDDDDDEEDEDEDDEEEEDEDEEEEEEEEPAPRKRGAKKAAAKPAPAPAKKAAKKEKPAAKPAKRGKKK